ncbi:MAG: hypothetical protein DM484_15105 [Candidatus Methylumidiphilus alinenensis]|uniref:Uncharacterized protein n=1 Tax=Candidatus Methylumidiphilus alinenensis TaxID=2202197 RepID=A0A2W4QZM0_9GAMM|nr:MAG: hypothetical protein DM484_15105 [Candidatus Methylumidiphilus alinenensis]
MATQTSVYLPDELLAELVRRAPEQNARSNLMVEALQYFFRTHQGVHEELDKINAFADELNQEAEDVLDYQVMP